MATIFTPEQAAEHLQVTRRTIYTWLKEGKLPGRKIGGSWRVSEAALEEFLRQPEPLPSATSSATASPAVSGNGSSPKKLLTRRLSKD